MLRLILLLVSLVSSGLLVLYRIPLEKSVDVASTNLAWMELPFFPFFVHPDMGNTTAVRLLHNQSFTKDVNLSHIVNQYIEHNERKKVALFNDTDSPCITKKRIILDVNRSGLGNRMLALSSAVMLSLLTGRTLELIWTKTASCMSNYEELFQPKKQNGPYFPFVYSKYRPYRSERRTEPRCYIHLTQISYAHLSFLSEEALFRNLDRHCQVLYIEGNQYYSHLLLNQRFNANSKHMKILFPSPFKNLAKVLFTPGEAVARKITTIMDSFNPKEKVWVSMHVRGFYASEKGVGWAIECANKLLERGEIDYLLFITESAKMKELARKLISEPHKHALSIPPKNFVDDRTNRTDSITIRDEMVQAVAEWYIVGNAHFCMSPSIDQSTFSSTSIARGDCKYIDYRRRSKCELADATDEKEHLLYEYNSHLTTEVKPLNSKECEKLWGSIVRTDDQVADEQCFDYNDQLNEKRTALAAQLGYWMPYVV